jgi:hypothetical protein
MKKKNTRKPAAGGQKRRAKQTTEHGKSVSGELLPARPTPRGVRLNSLIAIRKEMVRVYKDARSGRIPSSEGTRLVYVLAQIAEIWAMTDLEPRLRTIEERMGQQLGAGGRPVNELGIPYERQEH